MNSTLSERVAVIGKLDPASRAAGSVNTGLVPIRDFFRIQAVIQAGVLGASATLNAKIQGAVGAAGTPVDIPGAAITAFTKAGADDNKIAIINLNPDVLAGSGYTHIQLVVATGVADSISSALLLGGDARYDPAFMLDIAGVDEIVNV